MEISRMITMSTAHIKPDTAQLLENWAQDRIYVCLPSTYLKGDYGFYLYIPEECEFAEEYGNGENVPKDLFDCMVLALAMDCNILCLDGDGEILNCLPTYEWE